MQNPLISVIVPVFNAEPYLRQCIDSILVQTYVNLEVILVNDGSPDNCGDICDEYSKKDCRIKVIHKENGGPSDARNVGMVYSHGKYIAFVDSDDEIEPTFFRELIEAIKCVNAQVAVCGMKYVYQAEPPVRIVENNLQAKDKSSVSELFMLIENARLFNSACNKLYDASLIKSHEIQFVINWHGEDAYFNIDYFMHVDIIAIVDSALYCYNKRDVETLVAKYYPNLLQRAMDVNTRRRKLFEKFALDSEESCALLANLCSSYIGASINNLYKKDNKENLISRFSVFRSICSDIQISKDMKLLVPKSVLQKLLKMMHKIGSPHLMLIVYSVLFFFRYRFAGTYMKIRKRLM